MDIKSVTLIDGSSLEESLTKAYDSKDSNLKVQIINTIRNSAFNYDKDEESKIAELLYEKAQDLENSISNFLNNNVLGL